jgi:hypothetical protein
LHIRCAERLIAKAKQSPQPLSIKVEAV